MDYTIGSLADLITGSNTPNKLQVIQKGFKSMKAQSELGSPNLKRKKNQINNSETEIAGEPRKKKKKMVSEELEITNNFKNNKKNNSEDQSDLTNEHKNKKKRKKQRTELTRDFLDSEGDSPVKKAKMTQNDINAERRIHDKWKKEKKEIDPVDKSKTLFVGNVPIKLSKKKIQKFFKKYGEIEAIRIRGIPVADPKIPKKTAAIKQEFHPNRNSVICYIRFKNPEDVIKAEVANGVVFEGHHLRVHSCISTEKPDETKAIFVGNLSFDAEEEELWKLFETCGPIDHVRIIRDTYSGMGKGIAYVNFKESDAVQLALELEGVKLKNRELRVSLCNVSGARKNKGLKNKKQIIKPRKPGFRKPFNKEKNHENGEVEKGEKSDFQKSFNKSYQGSTFTEKKKKHKINKGLLEKKRKIKKIAPKSASETSS